MKLLFLILAHDRPEQALGLARVLVGAASDGRALIHYDARAPGVEFAALSRGVKSEPRIGLVTARVACAWGGFGLVEAPLAALAQMETEGFAADRVILLSGACLPCRPVAQLERYLAAHPDREFIEAGGEEWIVDGLRAERHTLYHVLKDPRARPTVERWMVRLQRLLGVRRRFPRGLTPRFGSQWWALTGDTCRAILTDIRARPSRLRFFRRVWIPDEMVFQTYAAAMVAPGQIAGFGLTHFQFTDRGKPVVLHDDHIDYVRTLPRFFARKVSPSAQRLRAAMLALAAEPDDGASLAAIGTRRRDYETKVAAQTWYPTPGQIFYRDQRSDRSDSVLAGASEPYAVLIGPPGLTRAMLRHLPEGPLARLGEIFAPGRIDFGEGREALGGLTPDAAAIRDRHPALFLARVRVRCAGLPVLPWSPLHAPALLERVLHDPAALCIACMPWSGNHDNDLRLLTLALRPEVVPPTSLGLPARLEERLRDNNLFFDRPGGLDWLSWDLFYRDGGSSLPQILPMAWNPAGDGGETLRRRHRFEAALRECRFAAHRWFPALAAGLQAAWDAEIEACLAERLYPDPVIRAQAGAADVHPPPVALGSAVRQGATR